MSYSQSQLVMRSDSNSNSNSNRRSNNNNNNPPRLTVAVGSASSGRGDISPTTRRWQRTFREIRNDICLVHQLNARFQSRGELFLRLCRLHGTPVIDKLRHVNSPPRLLPDHQNISACYALRFTNRVKSPSFTTDLVRDGKGHPIQVEIYDTHTQLVISPDCFLSSAKVRITVLDSDHRVLRAREGKGPILIGRDLTVHLKNGVGTFEHIIFNDNSSWANRCFRFGVIFGCEGGEGYLNGERVQEGVSEPFEVKDRKAKESQKPDQLELKHKVRSLKRVGKDRAIRLEESGINTVEDFLTLYYRDQSKLRKILGIKSESDKEWETMVNHAMECVNEFHAKNKALKSTSQPQQFSMLGRTGGPCLVGSCSSVPNPSENNVTDSDTSILTVSPMQHTIGSGSVLQVEIPSDYPMEDLLAYAEPTHNNISQCPLRSNSFDAGSCEALVQGFKASMSNSVYVGSLSPRRKAKIKVLLKLITFLAGPRKRVRIVPPAGYEALENTSEPQQPLGHLLARNASLIPNDGPLIAGLGSLEPNPCWNDINDQGFYGLLSPICDLPAIDESNEQLSTASSEYPVGTQRALSHDRNDATIERGNILNLNVNSMQPTISDGLAPLEIPDSLVRMDDLFETAESTYCNIQQRPSRNNSFDSGSYEAVLQGFFASIPSSGYQVPLTPRRKTKIKALLRSITFFAVPRKRARTVPPVTVSQTVVPAV